MPLKITNFITILETIEKHLECFRYFSEGNGRWIIIFIQENVSRFEIHKLCEHLAKVKC